MSEFLTIMGDSFSSATMLKIWTMMMKKYPMTTKCVNGVALPPTAPQLGAYAKHMFMRASS